ncbi:hypothetical protein PTKIN_Ptkin14bG0145400 [Pterospermum kingtungense]
MKLSFSLPSKSKSAQKPPIPIASAAGEEDDKNPKEFVTEFDPSKTLTDPNSKPSFIIPPKQNEWRPYKKMKNLDLPLQSDPSSRDLQFELESSSNLPDSDAKITYGLNVRNNNSDNKSANGEAATEDKQGIDRESVSAAPVETVLLQSLQEDLKRLPEDRGFEEFEDMAVEDFGKALLAGYGWVEGRGIGKNAKEDVKTKQYERRTAKEGLGFSSKDSLLGSKNPQANLDNKEERMKKKDEDRDGFFVGKEVRVIEGREMGSKGTIIEKLDGNWVVLKFKNSKEEVKVRTSEIADLGSKEEEKCLRKLKELKIRESDDSKRKRDERMVSKRSGGSEKRSETKFNVERDRSNGDRGISWLRSNIRVRIISKSLEGGRFYLKKGQVMDVVGPYMCDISMDGSKELIQGVEQELLETALPKRGGPVLVLYGRHKGVYGTLLERDMDRETGVVRDADSQQLLNVKLEQIAEYMGDPSYLGY